MADQTKFFAHAGTPEYAVFLLMERIAESEIVSKTLDRKEMLDLYTECLLAAQGKRSLPDLHKQN